MSLLSVYLGSFGVGTPSRGDRPWEFHTYLDKKTLLEAETSGPVALQLPEVLAQVFALLDGSALCTTVPLVCKQWHNAARSTLLWAPRLDPQLLSVARQLAGKTANQAQHMVQQLTSSTVPTISAVNLALLHHAVYGKNLLRNPCFVSNQNTGHSSGGAGGGAIRRAVVSHDQRKCAWVATIGDPNPSRWQCPPIGLPPGTPAPPPPLPYPTHRSALGLSEQLQGWLKGLSAGKLNKPAAGSACSATEGGVSCLATGSNWGEVVQVIDMVEELMMRGLSEQLATAVLDHAGLAVGLSVWVAAPEQQRQQQHTAVAPWATTTAAAIEAGEGTAASPARTHAQFAAALMLDDGQVPLKSFQTFVKRDSSHHFFSKRLAVAPGGWRRYAYLAPCVPCGCRRAVVLLRGRGPYPAQQQRSNSGVKFASAQLAFVLQSEVEAFGAAACLKSWADRQVTGR